MLTETLVIGRLSGNSGMKPGEVRSGELRRDGTSSTRRGWRVGGSGGEEEEEDGEEEEDDDEVHLVRQSWARRRRR
jgi:hypothetical protein